jgi:hypothetical protein
MAVMLEDKPRRMERYNITGTFLTSYIMILQHNANKLVFLYLYCSCQNNLQFETVFLIGHVDMIKKIVV